MAKRLRWVWDIESRNWDQVVCVVALSEAGDVMRWTGPNALEDAMAFMDEVKGTWIAHAGGIYDVLLALNVRERPMESLVLSGSAILTATDGQLKMRDSYKWWLNGLGKVGQYLDKEEQRRKEPRHEKGYWLKKDVDRSRIEELSLDETLAYCEHDCIILDEGVTQCLAFLESHGARTAWTAGGTALSLLAALEPHTTARLKKMALTLKYATASAACMRGARVECWANGFVPKVWVYDLKSAYPSCYYKNPLPIGAKWVDGSAWQTAHPATIWRCQWRWPWRERTPPVLDKITHAGAGWCAAWCVPEEVEDLLADGAEDLLRLEGWSPEEMLEMGTAFIDVLYPQKEQGSAWAKVFVNALHGKSGETVVREQWTRDEPETWFQDGQPLHKVGDYWRFDKLNLDKRTGKYAAPHIQPLAGATILGRTRSKLYRWIRDIVSRGYGVFYSDTDSVHTDCPPDKMPRHLGVGLGDLAFEGGPYSGIYLGPKAYCLMDATGTAVKGALKGVPWKSCDDAMLETAKGGGPMVRQARGKEEGSDLRRTVFEIAMSDARGCAVQKEGIQSFTQGVRAGKGWHRFALERVIKPGHRGKTFGQSSTSWNYKTPQEVLEGK